MYPPDNNIEQICHDSFSSVSEKRFGDASLPSCLETPGRDQVTLLFSRKNAYFWAACLLLASHRVHYREVRWRPSFIGELDLNSLPQIYIGTERLGGPIELFDAQIRGELAISLAPALSSASPETQFSTANLSPDCQFNGSVKREVEDD